MRKREYAGGRTQESAVHANVLGTTPQPELIARLSKRSQIEVTVWVPICPVSGAYTPFQYLS